jgi:transcriptional regulator with XRE-family HTH domain
MTDGPHVDAWGAQREALGAFIRTQRRLANLTLRQMADLAKVSNPYLSQIERGLHEPSVRVLRSIAEALNLSVETMLSRAGMTDEGPGTGTEGELRPTEEAIRLDPHLTDAQKEALLAVYRSFLASEG